jgi:hypothetical protein
MSLFSGILGFDLIMWVSELFPILGLDYQGGRLAMNNRLKVWIILGVLVVVIITGLIAPAVFPILLVFPTQRSIVVGLIALAVGSFSLYGGIKQHRATKGKGVSLPWWKSSLIIGALLQYCLAGLSVTTGLAHIMGESGIENILGTPFALLTVGLSIYVLILLWQQSETNRISKQPPADFQQLPPTMQ